MVVDGTGNSARPRVPSLQVPDDASRAAGSSETVCADPRVTRLAGVCGASSSTSCRSCSTSCAAAIGCPPAQWSRHWRRCRATSGAPVEDDKFGAPDRDLALPAMEEALDRRRRWAVSRGLLARRIHPRSTDLPASAARVARLLPVPRAAKPPGRDPRRATSGEPLEPRECSGPTGSTSARPPISSATGCWCFFVVPPSP